MFAELLVGNDALQVGIFALIGCSLASKKESKLLKGDWVGALRHNLADEVYVVHFLCNAEGLWVAPELAEDIEGCPESVLHLFRVGGVVRAREQVVADALIVVYVREVCQGAETLDLQEQIYSLGLLVVVNELRNNLVD